MTAILPSRTHLETASEQQLMPVEEVAALGQIAIPGEVLDPDAPPIPKPGEAHINQLGTNEKGERIYEVFDRSQPGRVLLTRLAQNQATRHSPHSATGPMYYGPRVANPHR